jgi:hypothetical protein
MSQTHVVYGFDAEQWAQVIAGRRPPQPAVAGFGRSDKRALLDAMKNAHGQVVQFVYVRSNGDFVKV